MQRSQMQVFSAAQPKARTPASGAPKRIKPRKAALTSVPAEQERARVDGRVADVSAFEELKALAARQTVNRPQDDVRALVHIS